MRILQASCYDSPQTPVLGPPRLAALISLQMDCATTPERMSVGHLRASTISTAFPRLLAFFSDIAARRIRARSARTAAWAAIVIVVCAFDVLHRLVVVVVVICVEIGLEQLVDIGLSAVDKLVDNVANHEVALAKDIGSALSLGLHPEEVPRRAGLELEHEDTAVGR